ncbi:hypothetical protein SESBI_33158 [Sesbania bispinosa]|nr:hypothetical protein SESBI_33158 [Sesbania bispinosa]
MNPKPEQLQNHTNHTCDYETVKARDYIRICACKKEKNEKSRDGGKGESSKYDGLRRWRRAFCDSGGEAYYGWVYNTQRRRQRTKLRLGLQQRAATEK